ncbi:hypothetical protein MMUC44124_00750 [Mycolicibacterium mucogenicum DSM 44124]|nr:hypothetical protein MMUC44124_00750 [Mycolicibacterium mucogenicum DSM 44124]
MIFAISSGEHPTAFASFAYVHASRSVDQGLRISASR